MNRKSLAVNREGKKSEAGEGRDGDGIPKVEGTTTEGAKTVRSRPRA